jgi:hypothetical protein
VLKTELLALLEGRGRLARVLKELDDDGTFLRRVDDDDRALLKRWVNDWTHRDHKVLWREIEVGARKLGNRLTAAGIFQDLIWRTVTAWRIANEVKKSGKDPIFEDHQARQKRYLHLADAADALAKYYRDYQEFNTNATEVLMPLLKSVELRLDPFALNRPMTITTLPLPVYSIVPPSAYHLAELHERQAKLFRQSGDWKLFSTTKVSHKGEHRERLAFVHTITKSLGELCGTQADGMPHRKVIAMLTNICFPDENVDDEDVRKMLEDRPRRRGGRKTINDAPTSVIRKGPKKAPPS